MTPHECGQLLAVAAKYDPRVGERTPEDTVLAMKAWSAALNPNMPYGYAQEAIIRHYGRSTERITPAHLNAAYTQHVRDQQHRNTLREITTSTGVPPTAEYLAAKAALWPERYQTGESA